MQNSNNGKKYKVLYGERHPLIGRMVQNGANINALYAETAEFAILTSILIEGGQVFLKASSIIRADDFYSYRNFLIFGVMEILADKGQTIDFLTVKTELETRNLLSDVGIDYLDRIKNMEYGLAHETYAEQIRDISQRRSLIVNAENQKMDAFNLELSFDEIASRTLAGVNGLMHKFHRYNDQSTLAGLLPYYAQNVRERNQNPALSPYIPTGLTHLDDCIGGLQKGALYVWGGATKMGKSSLLRRIAYNLLRQDKRVLFISLEMSVEPIITQMVSMVSAILAREKSNASIRIEGKAIQQGKMSDYQLPYFDKIIEHLVGLQTSRQFMIEEFRAPTIAQLNTRITQLMLECPIDCLIVDYLGGGLITPSRPNGKSTDIDHMNEAVHWLDDIGKTNHFPTMTAVQLNRQADTRGNAKGQNPKPNRGDVLGSSVYAQTAEVLGFVYRDHVYNPKTANPAYAELIIDANRSGQTDTIPLHWDEKTTTFSDWHTTTPVYHNTPKEDYEL